MLILLLDFSSVKKSLRFGSAVRTDSDLSTHETSRGNHEEMRTYSCQGTWFQCQSSSSDEGRPLLTVHLLAGCIASLLKCMQTGNKSKNESSLFFTWVVAQHVYETINLSPVCLAAESDWWTWPGHRPLSEDSQTPGAGQEWVPAEEMGGGPTSAPAFLCRLLLQPLKVKGRYDVTLKTQRKYDRG